MDDHIRQHQRDIASALAPHEWHRTRINVSSYEQLLAVRRVVHTTNNLLAQNLAQFCAWITEKQSDKLIDLFGEYVKQGVSEVDLSIMYVTTWSENVAEFNNFPIFKIRQDASYSPRFVDSHGRVYKDWLDFRSANQFPKCTMHFPTNGTYMSNTFSFCESPACSANFWVKIGDWVAKHIGKCGKAVLLVALPGMVEFSAIGIVTIVPCAVSAWFLCRGVWGLWDMYTHGESIWEWSRQPWEHLQLSATSAITAVGEAVTQLGIHTKVASAAYQIGGKLEATCGPVLRGAWNTSVNLVKAAGNVLESSSEWLKSVLG